MALVGREEGMVVKTRTAKMGVTVIDEDREVEEGSWFDWRSGMVRVRLEGIFQLIIYIVLPW